MMPEAFKWNSERLTWENVVRAIIGVVLMVFFIGLYVLSAFVSALISLALDS